VRPLVIWDCTVLPAIRPDRSDCHAFTHGILPVLIYLPRKDERLSWPRRLIIPRWYTRPQTVTHPSINRARRRVTTLIETNALIQKRSTQERGADNFIVRNIHAREFYILIFYSNLTRVSNWQWTIEEIVNIGGPRRAPNSLKLSVLLSSEKQNIILVLYNFASYSHCLDIVIFQLFGISPRNPINAPS